ELMESCSFAVEADRPNQHRESDDWTDLRTQWPAFRSCRSGLVMRLSLAATNGGLLSVGLLQRLAHNVGHTAAGAAAGKSAGSACSVLNSARRFSGSSPTSAGICGPRWSGTGLSMARSTRLAVGRPRDLKEMAACQELVG